MGTCCMPALCGRDIQLMSKASIRSMIKYYGMTVGWALYTVQLLVRTEPAGGISIASEMYWDLLWNTVGIIVGCVSHMMQSHLCLPTLHN